MSKRKRPDAAKAAPPAPTSGDDGLQQFRIAIKDLKTKSQSKIGSLTQLAVDHSTYAPQVVQILADEIDNAEVIRLQPLLFVADSILKKIGKDYKEQMSVRIAHTIYLVYSKADPTLRGWLQKMVNDSWRKHDLLPAAALDQLDTVFLGSYQPGAVSQAVPAGQVAPPVAQDAAPPIPQSPAAAASAQGAQSSAPAPPSQVQHIPAVPAVATTPAAAPPSIGQQAAGQASVPPAPTAAPQQVKAEKAARKAQAAQAAAAAAPATTADAPAQPGKTSAASSQAVPETPEVVERRLMILTKIIERRNPSQDELQEIMKVPEIRKAIAMQQKGSRQEAMTLLSKFKQELERKYNERKAAASAAAAVDPRSNADPRQQAAARPVDPRQQSADARPIDPRQQQKQIDPRQRAADGSASVPGAAAALQPGDLSGKRPSDAEAADPRFKQQRVAAPGEQLQPPAGGAEPAVGADGSSQKARPVLQGMQSIGFSETWLRQFMEQMPSKTAPKATSKTEVVPSVGRKVLDASGEQMVYVDEITPSETLLLLQMVFLLEERMRTKGSGMDLTQRIPHSFNYLQMEPAVDVMLKRFFDELPHQCTTTGLRFSTRDKLKKHHDAMYKRRAAAQLRQRGAEARGWMESIPEWVGNPDLVVGPALFKLGGAGEDAAKAQEAQRHQNDDEDPDGEDNRWICPLDERRSVCPISGERFERTWSMTLNDWAYRDVVAVEIADPQGTPLKFPSSGGLGPHGLPETAVLFKKSCFFNTPYKTRLKALEQCWSAQSQLAKVDGDEQKAVRAAAPKDDELAALLSVVSRPKRMSF